MHRMRRPLVLVTATVFVCLFAVHARAAVEAAGPPIDVDPRIVSLLGQVSEDRLRALLTTLVSFQTRNTLSAADSPVHGIGAARQWIFDELTRASPRLQVTFDSYRIPAQGERITREVELRNVMAVLPGRTARRVYISGHYDTLARQPQAVAGAAGGGFDWTRNDNIAPGADDDGSGTVLTMEAARILAQSGLEFDATLVFLCLAGEEQGLVGARLHAQRAEVERVRIDAVLNNDIVGNVTGGTGLSTARRSGSSQRVRRTRRHARLPGTCGGRPPGTFRHTRSYSSRATTGSAAGATIPRSTSTDFPACGCRKSRRTTRASTPRTTRSTGSPSRISHATSG